MKISRLAVLMVVLLLAASNVFAQGRNAQIELYGGVGFPLKPDFFKDYYKNGLSIHGQYVVFPSPRFGISFGAAFEKFSFDEDGFLKDVGLEGIPGLSVEGSASIVEFGIGFRPYLTLPEANTQFFLFGMGTFNLLKDEGTVSYTDEFGNTYSEGGSEDFSQVGVAAGAGIELPAGESLNIIIQGLVRFIFPKEELDDETLSFVGVTGGLVF